MKRTEQLNCHQAHTYVLNKLEHRCNIAWYENVDDFYNWNQIDECLLEWGDVVKDWDKQPSRDSVENGFIIIEKDESTYVVWELNKPSLDKFIEKVNNHKEEGK